MNYYKLFGAGMILLCCTLCGFYYSYKLSLMLNFLNGVIDFLSRLETNIRYFGDDVFKLIRLSAPTSLSEYFYEKKTPFNTYWDNAVQKLAKAYSVSPEIKHNLTEFGRMLGATDVEGQIKHIGVYKSVFTTERDNFQKEYKTKARLYKTLGFFAGAVLALLIL